MDRSSALLELLDILKHSHHVQDTGLFEATYETMKTLIKTDYSYSEDAGGTISTEKGHR